MGRRFGAPWSPVLVVVSGLVTVICLVTPVVASRTSDTAGMWTGCATLALMAGCALFTISGYTVTRDTILIHRLLWDTRLPLAGLFSAERAPKAMSRSIRLCGNGGFYSFTGLYWNRTLGVYRAFIMDPSRAVVLRYASRVCVVSPDAPEEFIQELGIPPRPAP